MRTGTVSYKLEDLRKGVIIPIGMVGENDFTRVIFDAEEVFKKHPDAQVTMKVQPPKGGIYPATVTRDGNAVIWQVKAADVAHRGSGELQLTFTADTMVEKSYIARTDIKRSLVGNGPAPDPVQDWVDNAEEVLEDLEAAEVHQPIIGLDGYWYTWNQGTGEYEKTNTKAQGQDGHSPVLTSSKSGKTTTIFADGDQLAQILDGEDGQGADVIDDTAGEGDTDKTWSADKLDTEITDVKTAIQGKPEMKNSSKTGVDLDFTDNFGNVVVRLENGHIETKEFNSKKAPQSVNDSALGDLDITDESGNVIVRLKDGHIKTKNFDSADLYGVVARNKDIIDGIYAACGWHQPTSTSKQFCLLVSGDCHSEKKRMDSLVQFLNSVDAFDAGIMLGDICMTSWENSAEYYTESLQDVQKPFLTVIGNHDAGWARQGQTSNPENGYTNLSDLCAKFITPNIGFADLAEGEYTAGNTYYYKDFTSQKIRIIVLNLYEYPNDINNGTFVYTRGQNCFSQEQITWFCNTLASTPSDFGVIIAQHSASSKMQCDLSSDWVSRMTSAAFQPEDLMDHDTDGWIIPQIVDAWINGTSLTKTFGYAVSGSWTSISVDVDFTSRGTGEFITYIGGHWHATILSNVYGYTDQKSFNVECLSLENAVYGDVPRKEGTRSEDCFCALAVDRTKKTVKLFYIGAHFTRNAVNRQYGQYSYAE